MPLLNLKRNRKKKEKLSPLRPCCHHIVQLHILAASKCSHDRLSVLLLKGGGVTANCKCSVLSIQKVRKRGGGRFCIYLSENLKLHPNIGTKDICLQKRFSFK